MTFPPPIPRRDKTAEQFAALRNLLTDSGFSAAAICKRLRLEALHDIEADTVNLSDYGPAETASDALTRLFLEGRSLAKARLEALLGATGVAQLAEFGLIEEEDDRTWLATVSLYPIEHLFTASDRFAGVTGERLAGWDDIVYPCLFRTTHAFLEGLPREAVGDVLDLCSGCGVAALLSANSTRVWAADITERSREFTRFNALLNGATNVQTLTGDLYAPAGDKVFDRIVAHPPYQPVPEPDRIFNSGGFDGEELTRRIVAEAPAHLNPGARLYCLCQLTDRETAAEQRVREWLGESSADCDVAFAVIKLHDVQRYTAIASLHFGRSHAAWLDWMKHLGGTQARHMAYGMLAVQRHERKRKAFTVRAHRGEGATARDFEALIGWETRARQPDFEDWAMSMRYRTRTSVKMRVTHSFTPGQWDLAEFRLENDAPWESMLAIDQVAAHSMTLFDGTRTGRQCLNQLREVAGVGVPAFADLIRRLAAGGFVEVL